MPASFSSETEDVDLRIDGGFGELTLTDELSMRAGKIKLLVGYITASAVDDSVKVLFRLP